MNPSDSLFLRLALSREWISRDAHDSALARLEELGRMGVTKSAEDVLREADDLDEERLRVLRRLLSQWTHQARIGDYVVLRRIGIGGTGMVFEARHRRVGKHVAIKVLFPRLEKEPGFRDRFLREARVLAQINHTNVVHAYDAGQDGEFHYIVTEMVEGEDLDRIVREGGALELRRSVEICLDVARGLRAIHLAGLVHRDIKPANVLLDTEGTAKVADLGLFLSSADREVRWEGRVFGTPQYMSPEQVRGDPDIDLRTDLYSLGALWYYVVTGQPLFPGRHPRAVARAQLGEEPVSPGQLCPELPAAMASLLGRLLRKRREDRPHSAAEVIEAFESWLSGPLDPANGGANGARRVAPARVPMRGDVIAQAPPPGRSWFERLSPLGNPLSLGVLILCGSLAVGWLTAVLMRVGTGSPAIRVSGGGRTESSAPAILEPDRSVEPPRSSRPTGGAAPDGPPVVAGGSRVTPGGEGASDPSSVVPRAPGTTTGWALEWLDGVVPSSLRVARSAMPGDALRALWRTLLPGHRTGRPADEDGALSAASAELPGWMTVGHARTIERFETRLAGVADTGRTIRAVLDLDGEVREVQVTVHSVEEGLEFRELRSRRQLALDRAAPAMVLAWGALHRADDRTLTDGIGYALVHGRAGFARRMRDLLARFSPGPTPDLPPDELPGDPGALPDDAVPSAVESESLQEALVALRRVLASRRAFERREWLRASELYGELALGESLPDSTEPQTARWRELSERSRLLHWVTTRFFRGTVEPVNPWRTAEVQLGHDFDTRQQLDDFRFRGANWVWQAGSLRRRGLAPRETLDTLAVFRLPLVVEGLWSPGEDVAPPAQQRGRLVITLDQLCVGLGGGPGGISVFLAGSQEETAFYETGSGSPAGAFRVEIARGRVRAATPDGVRLDALIGLPVPAFGRVGVVLERRAILESLTIIGSVEPIWATARIAALESLEPRPTEGVRAEGPDSDEG